MNIEKHIENYEGKDEEKLLRGVKETVQSSELTKAEQEYNPFLRSGVRSERSSDVQDACGSFKSKRKTWKRKHLPGTFSEKCAS